MGLVLITYNNPAIQKKGLFTYGLKTSKEVQMSSGNVRQRTSLKKILSN